MTLNGVSTVLLSRAFASGVTRKRSVPEYLSIFAVPHPAPRTAADGRDDPRGVHAPVRSV